MTAAPIVALRVEHLGGQRYRVTGGAAPHVVDFSGEVPTCDCPHHQIRRAYCKHLAAVERQRQAELLRNVRGLVARPAELGPPTAPSSNGDGLTHIRDLLAEPDDAVSWIVDGMLPAGGLSVFGGKPKGGKSTTARAIALRVCRGEPVLGRATTKGPVIYLGLEDPRRVTKGHLRTLGARPDDDLFVWSGPRPDAALAWLERTLASVDPVLVVVDTLQHLLGVSDLNDYARVVSALAPVLGLVRPRQAHMMLVHHAGKGDRTGFDAILGSTAIVGTVDVALLLRRRDDNTRTLATLQRAGDDLAESVVTLNEHQEPVLQGSRADFDARQVEERVLAWLGTQDEPVTRDAVKAAVEGRAELVVAALQRLARDGHVARTGGGKRGDPYLFAMPFRRSHLYPGTESRKPESGTSAPNAGTFSVPVDSATPSFPFPPSDPDAEARAAMRDGA